MRRLANVSKGTLFFGVSAALYLIVVLAKLDEPYNVQRWIFLAALISVAVGFHVWTGKASVELLAVFKYAHLLLAVVYFWGAAFGKWAKRGDPDEGAFSAMGGSGFGIVAVLLGVVLLALAIMRILGRTKVLPGLGVEQLTIIVGIAAWMNILAFVVGWLATFPAGTGWGVVVAYFPASLIPQLGAITLSTTEPNTTSTELDADKRRMFSLVALLGGIGVAAFPFLTWISAGSIQLSAMDETAAASENAPSGPRFGFILLILGVVIAVGALMRMRPRGLVEPGPNALLGHVLLAGGAVALLIPIATLLSILRLDIDVGAGLGLWLGLLAGLVLIAVAIVENRTRRAVAV